MGRGRNEGKWSSWLSGEEGGKGKKEQREGAAAQLLQRGRAGVELTSCRRAGGSNAAVALLWGNFGRSQAKRPLAISTRQALAGERAQRSRRQRSLETTFEKARRAVKRVCFELSLSRAKRNRPENNKSPGKKISAYSICSCDGAPSIQAPMPSPLVGNDGRPLVSMDGS